MSSRGSFGWRLGAVALAAFVLRAGFTLVVEPTVPAIGDATAYHHLANNLADGRGYIRPFDFLLLDQRRPTAEYPPLFPAAVAVASTVGVDSVTSQRLFACAIGAVAVAMIGLLGRRVAGPAAGLVAAALAAIYPMLFLSDATLTPEDLFVLLVAATLLGVFRCLGGRATAGAVAVVGLLSGLAALTRAEGALLVPLVAIPAALVAAGPELRRRVVLSLAVVAGFAAVLAPWTIRNAIRFDAVVPISNNIGTTLDGANCDAAYSRPELGFWRFSDACFEGFDQAALAHDGEAAVAAEHRRQGLAYARAHADRLPAVLMVRVLRTWGLWAPSQQTKLESLEGRPLAWQRAGTVMYWALVPGAGLGLVQLRRRGITVWPLLMPAVGVTITALVTYGNQRFRAAAEPGLLVLAAVALTRRGLGHAQDRGPERQGDPAE